MSGAFYHVLEQSPEVLPLVPDLCCRFLVFPAFAGVVALHELADVFAHHVVVQSTRKLLLPGNTHAHTRSNTGGQRLKRGNVGGLATQPAAIRTDDPTPSLPPILLSVDSGASSSCQQPAGNNGAPPLRLPGNSSITSQESRISFLLGLHLFFL